MEKIHVNRDRVSLGKFTPEEVSGGLKSGEFKPTDLAWREGMETWQPLSEFTDLPEATEPITVPPAPGEPMELAAEGYGQDGEGISDTVDGAAPSEEVPWERADALGWMPAFTQTLKGTLFTPGQTLAGATLSRTLMRPFSYYLILALGAGLVALVIGVWVMGMAMDYLRASEEFSKDPEIAKLLANYTNEDAAMRGLAFLALGAPLAPFFFAGLCHAFLMSFGAARQPFTTSFSVICYALGSASLLQIIPCCGSVVQIGWLAVSASIGLAVANKVPTWQAAVSVVMTLLIGCGIYAGISTLSAAA